MAFASLTSPKSIRLNNTCQETLKRPNDPEPPAYHPTSVAIIPASPSLVVSVFSADLQPALVSSEDLAAQSRKDVFWLGLVLLDCLTLGSLALSTNICLADLTRGLQAVRDEYSDPIFRVVREMLVLQPSKRPDALMMQAIANKQLGQ